MNQRTIKSPVSVSGIGLHSGKPVRVTLAPAPPNSGIVFRERGHTDRIPAAAESVSSSHYATTIGWNGTRIQTVEHLLAATSGLGIDNLEVEVEGGGGQALNGRGGEGVQLRHCAGRATAW